MKATFIMSKTYAQVVKQIEALKAEAEKLRQDEVDGVIARIKEAIVVYNLTAADLGLGAAGPRTRAPKAAAPAKRGRKKAGAKTAGVVKYRNDSGGTWGGRGKRPQWLRDALAAGKQLSDFEVK